MTRATGDGSIRVPGDKSISHRALLLAALADGESRLEGLLPGADCRSTAGVLRHLGVPVPELPSDGAPFALEGVGLRGLRAPGAVLDCGNSGTTARLLLGLLAGLGIEATLDGDESLRARPMARVTDPLQRSGAAFREEGSPGRLPLRVVGGHRLGPIRHRSPVASAQVKSALLLAGVGADAPVEVLEPVRSRDHTERMLRRMGAAVTSSGGTPHRLLLVDPPARLEPMELRVPGDVSSAAFFVVLALVGGTGEALTIADVGLNPTRTGLLQALERMGGRVERSDEREGDDPAGEPAGHLTIRLSDLAGIEVAGADIPSLIDEIPILAVAAARAEGTTVIRDAAELRVKESDRLRALALNLREVGVQVEELPDGLVIEGSDRPLAGRVRAFHDHRIAMAFGVLGALPGNHIEVDDPGVVDVSFPGFWELLRKLAGPAPEGGERTGGGRPPGVVRSPVVTIDGPAGSGKSTTAREVARRLGLRHLDSGALYRALTLALLDEGLDPSRWEEEGPERLRDRDLRLEEAEGHFRVLLDGEAPGDALRSPEVNAGVARLAAIPEVRELVLGPLRRAARRGGVVADGRDMGSVVLPDADLKVFLTASLEERARRRLLQEGGEPGEAAVRKTAEELAQRDRIDESREVAPLRRPEGAFELDTTGLDLETQVERVVRAVDALGRGAGAGSPARGG
jgi:3-phosphoshikimate 1-carboxyvinyltransferase